MSDYKSAYSDISKDYIDNIVPSNAIDQGRFERSKDRENLYNDNWIKQKVNLNEIVDRFIPAVESFVAQYTEGGVKYNFEGVRYVIKCDKVAGYLRIYDKKLKAFCFLDGEPCRDNKRTHFKIRRREEM